MPGSAMVTDIYRNQTHTTWLNTTLQTLALQEFFLAGDDPDSIGCADWTIEFENGGNFVFKTNLGGTVTLVLDLNNNGVFDSCDVELEGAIPAGTGMIHWDGKDACGSFIPKQDSFPFKYWGVIRFGEFHIGLNDVENNPGGVTFKWMNAPPNQPNNLFYYDHSPVGGPVSSPTGPVTGNPPPVPQATTIPFKYGTGLPFGNNFGNLKYLDQWFFVELPISQTTAFINIVDDCPCSYSTPVLEIVSGGGDFCEGETVNLSVQNTATLNIPDTLTFVWTGPNGTTVLSEKIPSDQASTFTITSLQVAQAGTYKVVATTDADCPSAPLSIDVNVGAVPVSPPINLVDVCEGDQIILSVTNANPAVSTINYQWSGPGIAEPPGTTAGNQAITLTIPSASLSNNGTFTLTWESGAGCDGLPVNVNVSVKALPVLTNVTPDSAYCENSNFTLSAMNSTPGFTNCSYTWTGPNGSTISGTGDGDGPYTASLTNVNLSHAGNWTLTLICDNGCQAVPQTALVTINKTPEINGESPNDSFCEGTNITLTAENNVQGTGPINYTWTGPNGYVFNGFGAPELGPFDAPINNLSLSNAGVYTLILSTAGGCKSTPQTVNLGVWPRPVIVNTDDTTACVGQNVTLSGFNSANDVLPLTYSWQGPNNIGPVLSNNNGPYNLVINNVQQNDEGQYTLTLISEAGCLSESKIVTLTVEDGLNLVDVTTSDTTYCEGNDVTLSANNTVGAGQINYTWTVPNGPPVTGTAPSPGPIVLPLNSIKQNQEGTYTLSITSQAGCTADPVTVNVDVEPLVTISPITGAGKRCEGDPINLSATGSGSTGIVNYSWVNENGDVICSGSADAAGPFPCSNIASDPSSTGDYTLIIETANKCRSEATASLEIVARPNIIDLHPDSVLCELDTIFFFGQNGNPSVDDFIWKLATPSGLDETGAGFELNVFTDLFLPAVTYGEGVYTLILDNDGCLSEPESFTLTLNPNPIMSTISGGGAYCTGDTVCLTFQNLNPAVLDFFHTCNYGMTQVTGTGTGTNPVTLCIDQPGFVFCSLESADGCVSDLVGTEIIWIEPPVMDLNPEVEICEGDTLFLNAQNIGIGQGNVTYTWRRPDNTILTTSTTTWNGTFAAFDPNPIPGEYCIVASLSTNADCASDEVCVNVTINPRPEVTVGIDGGGTFCVGESITLTATVFISNATVINYGWTKDGTLIAFGTANSGDQVKYEISSATTDDSGEYCILLISEDGCEKEGEVCTQVTVNAAPQNCQVTSGGGEYCEDVTVTLNGECQAGGGTVNYVWLGPNAGVLCSGTAPSQGPFPCSIPNIQENQAGIYTLIVSIGDCEADPLPVVVDVNPRPEGSAAGGGTFCEGDMATLTFTVDPSGANNVDWKITGPLVDTSGNTSNTITISLPLDVLNLTAGTYTLQITSDKGCEGDPASATISIQQPQAISISASPNPLCAGEQLTLTATAQQGTSVSYEWYKDGVLIGTTTVPTFVVPNATSGQYSVIAKVDACESVSTSVAVTLVPAPAANDDIFQGVVNTPLSGNVLGNDVTGGANVNIFIVNQPSNGTVTINPDGTFTYQPDNAFSGEDQFTYRICLAACTNVCDEATVRINIPEPPCIVPNVITPNGDEANDVLIVECLPVHPNNRIRIFNRWGDEIYTAEPYLNDWDGTYGSDKKPLPAATYFYMLQLDKSKEEFVSGYITLHR
jgi:gliding motility-associated-like protein